MPAEKPGKRNTARSVLLSALVAVFISSLTALPIGLVLPDREGGRTAQAAAPGGIALPATAIGGAHESRTVPSAASVPAGKDAPGDLDPSFGSGGIVTTYLPQRTDSTGHGSALLPDGRVVEVGTANNVSGSGFAVTRRNSNGTADATFGRGGQVLTKFPGEDNEANAMALQSDGKIVVGGYSCPNYQGVEDFALARYNTDGSLDTSFGTGGTGQVVTDLGDNLDEIRALAIQTDGKILAAGLSGDRLAIARYNADGTLDPSFGTGGLVLRRFNNNPTEAEALVVQPDGKIIAGGGVSPLDTQFAVARFNTNGALDTSFNGTGFNITDFGANDSALIRSVKLQADGAIVAAGNVYTDSGEDFALARYLSTGGIDTSFGTGGKLTTDFNGTSDDAYSLVIQPDGRIVAGGQVMGSSPQGQFGLARYNSNGSLDLSYGPGGTGKVTADFGTTDGKLAGMALQPDGKILGAGTSFKNQIGNQFSDFGLMRFNTDGSLDTSFGTGGSGKVVVTLTISGAGAQDVKLQSDGKILAAGSANSRFVLARYNVDGSLDGGFGSGGIATTQVGPTSAAYALAQQADNKIVLGGFGSTGDYPNYALTFGLARFNTDGSLDTSFGNNGVVTTTADYPSAGISALAIQPDGKIVAGGTDSIYSGGNHFVLARYNLNGTLDSSFGSGGVVIPQNLYGAEIDGLALQPDGKIVVSGIGQNGSDHEFVVARFNTDGSFDATFGNGGLAFVTTLGEAYSVALQSDGKILAAGMRAVSFYSDFGVARLNSNGSPDTSFGNNGVVTTSFGQVYAEAEGIAIQPDNKYVVAGYAGANIALARYNTDGSPDTSFGSGGSGTVLTGLNLSSRANGLALQPDARIVVAGSSHTRTDNLFALARYESAPSSGTATPTPPTPSSTPATATSTSTPAVTRTSTRTVTPTSTGTLALTSTVTPTSASSNTSTPVRTPTFTPTGQVATFTPGTTTATASATPTGAATGAVTGTPTAQATGSPASTPLSSATPCSISFSDVSSSDYFYEAVTYLSCHGAISGYSDGTFRPYNNTTRGQLSKIVVLAEGWTIDTTGGPHFSDVGEDNPFYTYIETAYHHGVISGYSDGTFRWGNNVTRGQLSKIIVVAQQWPIDTTGGPHFSDVPESNPFYNWIETAYNHLIISGYSDGTFRPGNNATRGQISKIVYNAIVSGNVR